MHKLHHIIRCGTDYSTILLQDIILTYNIELQHGLESVSLRPHMPPADILHTGTAWEGHGDLELILKHFKDPSHPMFSLCSQPIDYWPSNLQELHEQDK